jgi:hypothetical protein
MSTSARPGYSLCKGCHKEILWAVDEKGTKHPLDTTPPTFVVVGYEKDGTAQVKRSNGYVSHFATCAAAEHFSGKNRQKTNAE